MSGLAMFVSRSGVLLGSSAGQERGDGPLDLLEDDRRQVFLERYEAEIAIAYPAQPDGKVLLSSPTVFIL